MDLIAGIILEWFPGIFFQVPDEIYAFSRRDVHPFEPFLFVLPTGDV
jgi:hypothetical protein